MVTHEQRVPTANKQIAVLLAVISLPVIVGATIYIAPLMSAQGWTSSRAVLFLGSAGAALALWGYCVVGLIQKLRRR